MAWIHLVPVANQFFENPTTASSIKVTAFGSAGAENGLYIRAPGAPGEQPPPWEMTMREELDDTWMEQALPPHPHPKPDPHPNPDH